MIRERHRAGPALLFLLLLGASGCAGRGREPKPDEAPEAPRAGREVERGGEAIVLDSATIATIGLRTAVLGPSRQAAEREVPAEVVRDPGGETTVRAGLTGRLIAEDGRSWPTIGEELSVGDAVAHIGDGVAMRVPRSGTVTSVLALPGELVQAGQGLLTLTDFSTALIRIAGVPDAPVPPPVLQLSHLTDHGRFPARRTGPADAADPSSRGPAWYYRSAGSSLLRPGVGLVAYLPDPTAPHDGLLVPSEAVVQWDALAWVFVERAPGRFSRVRVPTDHPVPGGWLVANGFQRGDRVVTRAAEQLLSEEFRARIVVGEEVGE